MGRPFVDAVQSVPKCVPILIQNRPRPSASGQRMSAAYGTSPPGFASFSTEARIR
jgi:hypothetical protein